jgi:hypothetical protein
MDAKAGIEATVPVDLLGSTKASLPSCLLIPYASSIGSWPPMTATRSPALSASLQTRISLQTTPAGEGNEEGAAIWRQIAAAVEELQRARRPDKAVP